MSVLKINGQPVDQPHNVSEVRTPQSITLRCTCGWWTRQTRHQNALARQRTLVAAVDKHATDCGKPVLWTPGAGHR